MTTKENILKKIFFDENHNWDNFVKLHPKNIRKIVPPRCKGRFCSVCATGYMQEWGKKTAESMYNLPHRHIMFTLPEELWEIFLNIFLEQLNGNL